MDVAVSMSDLHAEGSLMENTPAEMSPVALARQTLYHPGTPEQPYTTQEFQSTPY